MRNNGFLRKAGAMLMAGCMIAGIAANLVHPVNVNAADAKNWSEEPSGYGYNIVTNKDGKTLGYAPKNLKLLEADGFAFKDMNADGELNPYEDWRLSDEERAADLADRLSIEEIAGLMCFSAHQRTCPSEPTDEQKAFLDGNVRAVLNAASGIKPSDQIAWANAMQMYVEGKGFSIPINFSTDPRNGENVSNWPGNLGLAATFDPEVALEAGKVMAQELRALGIGTLLGPQVDVASDPRWQRFAGTFGEDPALSRDMTRALIDGLQSTYVKGEDMGWGAESVLAMVKHWPAEGPGEFGREGHKEGGKFAVYPGENFNAMLIPFVDGAFHLNGKTECAAEVMASYTIAWSDTEEYGKLVGSAFSKFKIQQLLRKQYGFTGAVCTDWFVLNDSEGNASWRSWGLEDNEEWNPVSRCFETIKVGIDQEGGLNDSQVIIDAYKLCIEEEGEAAAKSRFSKAAARLLKGYFTLGLFENPYIDEDECVRVVNSKDKQAAALAAQVKGIVMLKNHGGVIAPATDKKLTVYVPMVYTAAYKVANSARYNAADSEVAASCVLPIDAKLLGQYFNVVTDKLADPLTGPADKDGKATVCEADIIRASKEEIAACDLALIYVNAPINYDARGGHDPYGDWAPLSLQYRKYVADNEFVREESIAGDTTIVMVNNPNNPYGAEPKEMKENRGYFGGESFIVNEGMLDQVLAAAAKAKEAGIPSVALLNIMQPMCVHEFESEVDAIVVSMSGCNEAALKIIAGKEEPSGLLPMQMPLNMLEVEKQLEDVPRDMVCYTDADGNTYDFAFGLNYSGVIKDERTEKYSVPALTEPEN